MQLFALGLLLAGSSSVALIACATYGNDLATGQRAFEQSEHERALAIFRALEPDIGRLSLVERAHYAYLRGMTDYRIGYRSEARHWLALASALDQKTPGSLPPDWEKRMSESLKELNEEVYSGGISLLSSSPAIQNATTNDGDAGATHEAPTNPGPP
jgi:hypothetical protein